MVILDIGLLFGATLYM